jgi:hypothetical protein
MPQADQEIEGISSNQWPFILASNALLPASSTESCMPQADQETEGVPADAYTHWNAALACADALLSTSQVR